VTNSVCEQRFDALVLRDVVHDTEKAAVVAPLLGHLHDLDGERTPAGVEGNIERHRLTFPARSRKRGDVRHQDVGWEHSAQVAAKTAVRIERKQCSVAGVGVYELAYLVVVDCNHERGLGQRVEDDADIGGQRRRITVGAELGTFLGAPLRTRLGRVFPSLPLRALHNGCLPPETLIDVSASLPST